MSNKQKSPNKKFLAIVFLVLVIGFYLLSLVVNFTMNKALLIENFEYVEFLITLGFIFSLAWSISLFAELAILVSELN